MKNFIFLILIVCVILLQVFLSKKDSRWPGLILPIFAFLYSFLYPFSMVAPAGGITIDFVVQLLFVWLIANLPTGVLLAIYFSCQRGHYRNKQQSSHS